MKNTFLPYELTILVHEKKFETDYSFASFAKEHNSSKILPITNEEWISKNTSGWINTGIECVLYQQVIYWLMDKYNIHIIPKVHFSPTIKYYYRIYNNPQPEKNCGYNQYETLDEAIKNALELI